MKKSLFARTIMILSVFALALIVVASPATTVAASIKNSNVKGNNGTLKVHEIGTPSGTESNDPKVCAFDLEGFGLDPTQTGFLQFVRQDANSAAVNAKFAFGTANAAGYAKSQTFNTGVITIPDGHYVVSLYGKDTTKNGNQPETEKAKSKVFAVRCATETTNNSSGDTKPETATGNVISENRAQSSNNTDKTTPTNDGTLKVHEIGTPVMQIDNDPKVCAFDIEGFNFDSGQTGYFKFSVQGNDAPHGVAAEAVYAFGPTNSEGYAISATKFNTKDGVKIANGHYKVTLYGKADMTDEKAKSKVFKVTCAAATVPPTNNEPTTPPTSGQVLGDATTATTTAQAATAPLQNTGVRTFAPAVVAAGLGIISIIVFKKRAVEVGKTQAQIELIAL